jgi:carbon monoxide dehydrogenase subunit G
MADYERSQTVDAKADDVFGYLSDVGNLPRYFSRMTDAEATDGDAVRVTAQIDAGSDGAAGGESGEGTREVEGEAWFKVDEAARTITWGSEGPNDYRGGLEVSGNGDSATVTVRLHTERDEADEIEPELAWTLENVMGLVEGR